MERVGTLRLHLLHGAPVLAGVLAPDDAAALQSRGVELLSAAAVAAADVDPPLSPSSSSGSIVYLKDYSAAEMAAATAGECRFHAGWTLSAFIAAFPEMLAPRVLASPIGEAVVGAGLLDDAARAALGATASAGSNATVP